MSVERWSVWLANLDPVVGSEQGRTRPVLVVSQTPLNDILPVVNMLPITSRKAGRRIYPNEALLPAGTAGTHVRVYRVVLPDQDAGQAPARACVRDA